MKRFLYLAITLLLTSSCVHKYQYKQVEPYYIFHANSSKVWVLNHIYEGNIDRAPLSLKYKKMFVFHKSGAFYEYDIQHLGEKRNHSGLFYLNIEAKKVEFHLKREICTFQIEEINEEKIILKPIKGKAYPFRIELIPFPEY